jgi:hypothetical protein
MTYCHLGVCFLFYWSNQEFIMSFPLFKSLVTLAATATLTIQPTLAADKVKIGFVSTLSGPSAALGVDIRDAFMLASLAACLPTFPSLMTNSSPMWANNCSSVMSNATKLIS